MNFVNPPLSHLCIPKKGARHGDAWLAQLVERATLDPQGHEFKAHSGYKSLLKKKEKKEKRKKDARHL